jgi:hypothetical protein
MDFLFLIAEAAKEASSTVIDENFVKWLAGFLVAGYAPILFFLKQLLDQRKTLLEGQVKDANTRAGLTETIRKELEGEIRKRYQKVIDDKDANFDKIEVEVKQMRVDKLHMLTKQIEDGHLQEKSLADLSEDYNEALRELKPVLSENVEVLQYYRTKRERGRP